jgi:bifunctional non-homologous end joining protein LigD
VLVPIARRHTYERARAFAGIVAHELGRAEPALFDAVHIDAKMNGHGQQVVSGYSVRPLPGAPVATPLHWDELDEALDPRDFSLTTVPDRLSRLGDLHAGLLHGRQRLPS